MPASSGRPGPGEITIPAGARSRIVIEAERIIAADDRLGAKLARGTGRGCTRTSRSCRLPGRWRATCATLVAGFVPESRFPYPRPNRSRSRGRPGVRWEIGSSFTYCLSMPRRTKEAPGRVTPKADTRRQATAGTTISGRYTAPVPMEYRHSPWWVPASMLTFFAVGLLMIVLNYMSLLPSSPNQLVPPGRAGVHRLRLRHFDSVPLATAYRHRQRD